MGASGPAGAAGLRGRASGATLVPRMEIARERFLDTGRDLHLTLALRSRTPAMHSLLTSLTPDERAEVSAALAQALDEVVTLLRRRLQAPPA